MVKSEKIHSIRDIELEKQRLKLEILKTENHIHASYHELIHSLSPRNIAVGLISEIATTSNVVSKAISFGQILFGKRKKKAKHPEPNVEPIS